jgi:wyosine [tRNA(Phe)-imidazoG37] synthetase (radical SAM superfamily)
MPPDPDGPGALSVENHDRDSTGMRYVYAVISRRAGGVSVGINLNPNNACNWRCVYCQVPDLVRGSGPAIDLPQLERELRELLRELCEGDFMQRRVPEEMRVLRDLAFSGNGEPTSSPDFEGAIERAARVRAEFGLETQLPFVLISNGSLMGKSVVREGIARLASHGGSVWFKLDSATAAGLERTCGTPIDLELHLRRLTQCAAICPTWIQSCFFERAGTQPDTAELDAYLAALARLRDDRVPIEGVLLYTLARESQQPQAAELAALSEAWLDAFAVRIATLGLEVRISS